MGHCGMVNAKEFMIRTRTVITVANETFDRTKNTRI